MSEKAKERGIPKSAYIFFKIANSQIAHNSVILQRTQEESIALRLKSCTKISAASRNKKIEFGVQVPRSW